jgi:ABC-type lipoprotein release transport system permease subunit
VSGVDVAAGRLGPIASAQLTSGRTFATTDTSASAVLDAGFATAQKLAVGSTLTVAEKSYPVIGIVNQASGATPAEVYLPLSEVQKLTRMADDVNTIYIATKDSKAVPAVRDRIASLLPGAKVTSADNLAGQVSGSLSTAARLIDTVGRWLAIIVLLAAFALACLLTLAAVSRRANELGLLKALGWQIRRVIGQITGETLTQGLAGAVLGIGLGAGAIGIIAWVSPSLSAAVAPPSSAEKLTGPCPGGCSFRNSLASSRNVNALTLSPHIDLRLVLIAVLLAVAGGLVAGVFGGWRASRLPPAIALRRVD